MIDKDLQIYDSVCTGCSACTEACYFPDEQGINPIQLIINQNDLAVPRINSDTCTSCMMCYKACPTEDKIFNHDNIDIKAYEKKILHAYYGYSQNYDHRFEAATAGVATEIASYLLKTQQVDGVVSSYQDENAQIITKIFTDREEVKKTKGSIYRQVSLLNGLEQMIKKGNHKKLLVIGLPCHIEGLKTLHKANKYLKKNIEFITIALFCKQTKTEEFSNAERNILHAKENQTILFRGKGWPGITRVEGGEEISSSNIQLGLAWSTYAFTPDYCFSCSDPLGLVADIAIGDAWLPEYTNNDKVGSSLFVTNTLLGGEIISGMMKENILYVKKESKKNIIKSQSYKHINYKLKHIKYKSNFFADLTVNEKIPLKYQIFSHWIKINKKLSESLYKRNLATTVPPIILKLYTKIINFSWKYS